MLDSALSVLQRLSHPAPVRAVAFSEDERRLFAACYDGAVYVYFRDAEAFAPLTALRVHEKEAKGVAVWRGTVATCGRDRRVCVLHECTEDPLDYDTIATLQCHS